MNFNDKLIKLRKLKGLSQEELGDKLNVTRQTVSKWELGQSTPEMENLIQLSKIFNVSIDTLTNDNDYVGNEGKKSKKDNNTVIILIAVLVPVLLIGLLIGTIFIYPFYQQKKMADIGMGMINNIINFGMSNIDDNNIDDKTFNNSFENWMGTQYGDFTRKSFDEVAQNNAKATQRNGRIVILVFNGKSMTDPVEIIESKKELNDYYKYEKYVEYDSEGYVNKVIIEQINDAEKIQQERLNKLKDDQELLDEWQRQQQEILDKQKSPQELLDELHYPW